MARFKRSKYKSDSGQIHPIRLRQATYSTVQGTEPTGDINNEIPAKISRSKRAFGLRPRGVVIARTRGAGDDTFTEYARLPVLDPEDFNSATGGWVTESNVSYKGVQWEIVARFSELPEVVNTSSGGSAGGGDGGGAIAPAQ